MMDARRKKAARHLKTARDRQETAGPQQEMTPPHEKAFAL
jgi:hypothetical protein